ncbi:MAG: hypothetical protein CM15mP73_1160 [Hyphomicrobiales bacterium]|nr:MAG: hypothetical protein CM15mP73_1160 [Hyphomicrobiales bacterium]
MSNSQNYKRLDVWLVDNKYFSQEMLPKQFLGSVLVKEKCKKIVQDNKFDVVQSISKGKKH